MKEKAEKFPVNLFCSLMLLGFIPFVYTLVRTNLIANGSSADGLNIAGHLEWFDLINETIQAFLIVPLYALLNPFLKYVMGIENFQTIKHILVILIPFYLAYNYTVLFDNILIGYGKTQYCFGISAVVNLIYYPIIYGLMSKGIFQPDITFICMMFGFGMVTHLVCSIICFSLYRRYSLKKIISRHYSQ